MPISRLRSRTLTSKMFITPMPPTRMQIAATHLSTSTKMLITLLAASICTCMVTVSTARSRLTRITSCAMAAAACGVTPSGTLRMISCTLCPIHSQKTAMGKKTAPDASTCDSSLLCAMTPRTQNGTPETLSSSPGSTSSFSASVAPSSTLRAPGCHSAAYRSRPLSTLVPIMSIYSREHPTSTQLSSLRPARASTGAYTCSVAEASSAEDSS